MRLIDADMLYRGLCDWQYGSFSGKGWETEYAILESVLDGIQRQPTIDVAPVRRGHWIEREEDGDRIVYCSECFDEYTDNLELASWVKHYFKFCPNCGSVMSGTTQTQHAKSVGQRTQDVGMR